MFATILKLHGRDAYQSGKMKWQDLHLLRRRVPQILLTSEKEFKELLYICQMTSIDRHIYSTWGGMAWNEIMYE